jgi:single-stranded-DNA-specific exonuclease
MTHWIDPQPVVVPDALRDTVGGHPLVATVLARRGITTPAGARAFLDPDRYMPTSARELLDVEESADRVWRALTTGERIAIWGDFDVDGQTATALLVETLREISSTPKTSPRYWVPTRGQGHGIHLSTLDELLDHGVTLLITCDTGVDAFAAIQRAADKGCDVIVTDHHDLPPTLPPALAIVNPNRLPADHPLHELPGVGVAYKLIERLLDQTPYANRPEAVLDLVALGIVADVATQVADVRYLLQRGLEALRTTKRVGLRALIEQAELQADGLTEEHVAYQLAPRLNALGRLNDANRGVELLTTQDTSRARILAAEMDGLNYQQRLITRQVLQAALAQVERDPSLLDYRALVVAGHNWHLGVLGLVASRLAMQFERPAVALSLSDGDPARGSARSVPGCDIHAALKRTADLLLRFGGHPGAAGMALDPSNLDAFRKALSRSVAAVWDPAAVSPGLQIDAYVSLNELSLDLVSELERLAPFGPGNPAIQLATRDLRILEDTLIGRDGEHRRLVVADEEDTQQTVLWWQGAGQPLPEGRFDLAYSLRARDYRGELQLQVEWINARSHSPARVLPPRRARTIVDWRGEVDPSEALVEIPKDRGESDRVMVVWVEAADHSFPEGIVGTDRLSLTPAPVLVIWTAPPGPDELAHGIQVVSPATVYLVAVEPVTGQFRPFVERMAGMVKHDLRTRGGQVDVPRLAAALGHREATVRVGLEWLSARGELSIVERGGDTITLQAGGELSPDLPNLEVRLRRLLDESAAYRRHLRSAPIESLGVC